MNIIFKTILDPGDEVIVFAPYFGEYKSYAANFDAEVVEVAPDFETFQPDLAALEKAVNEKTKAVVICPYISRANREKDKEKITRFIFLFLLILLFDKDRK